MALRGPGRLCQPACAGRLRVNNGDVLRDATIAGLGIALLALCMATAAIEAGDLSVIDFATPTGDEFIFVAHADGRPASTKLRALDRHLRAVFGDPPYWDRGLVQSVA